MSNGAQITPSVQVFVDPSNYPNEDAIAVLSIRARVAFYTGVCRATDLKIGQWHI